MVPRWFHVVVLAASCVASAGSLAAQEDSDEAARLREKFRDAPLAFEIIGGPGGTETLELVRQPILNWSNPERRTPAGALFLWTLRGRPQAAMGIYPVYESIDHEFQSLSPYALKTVRRGVTVWQPNEPGMEMKPLDAVPPPSQNQAARLRQLRGIAREFSADLVPPQQRSIPLRLLASPVYRYADSPSSGIIDGAMFVFVQGTDPEVMLLIEALAEPAGDARWQFGLARMTMVPITVSHQQQPVWKTEPGWPVQNLRTSYLVVKEE